MCSIDKSSVSSFALFLRSSPMVICYDNDCGSCSDPFDSVTILVRLASADPPHEEELNSAEVSQQALDSEGRSCARWERLPAGEAVQ